MNQSVNRDEFEEVISSIQEKQELPYSIRVLFVWKEVDSIISDSSNMWLIKSLEYELSLAYNLSNTTLELIDKFKLLVMEIAPENSSTKKLYPRAKSRIRNTKPRIVDKTPWFKWKRRRK